MQVFVIIKLFIEILTIKRKDAAVKAKNQLFLNISLVQELCDRDPPAKFLNGVDF
jgi:hypothetical protein